MALLYTRILVLMLALLEVILRDDALTRLSECTQIVRTLVS